MDNFYKENFYTIGELLQILQTLPKDYTIEAHSGSHDDYTWGSINDIDVYPKEKKIILWYE